MNNYKQHQTLLNQVILAIQKKMPRAIIFTRHVGLFKTLNDVPIKINKPGMADIWFLYRGKHVEIEIKTGKSRQSKVQKNWQKQVEKSGGYYFVIRSVDDVELIVL